MKRHLILYIFLLLLPLFPVHANTADKAEEQLRRELEKLEEEARILEQSLQQQKNQTATIQRDVNVLQNEIGLAQNKIDQKNYEIRQLSNTIALKESTIAELDAKRERAEEDLKLLIQKSNELDQMSLPEILLSNMNLSEFFQEFDEYALAQRQLNDLFEDIREIQGETAQEKEELEEVQNQELDAKAVIVSQQNVVKSKKSQQDSLLAASKKSEATYESILAERRAQAASIRAALFELRGSEGIPFGDALAFAEEASRATGVRSAFILAILKQESDIGKNVGLCVIHDLESGKSRGVNTGRVFNQGIHPTRDLPVLKKVVGKLGMDPENTRISCPLIRENPNGTYSEYGYGGAMGPSQFIPSTWVLYESKIASIVGASTANPWNPEHAIIGTALLLKDNGAAAGGYTAERNAALRYYAGGNWNLPQNAFYGNGVMAKAEEMQRQIDFLEDVAND